MFSPAVRHQLVSFVRVEAKSSRRMWVVSCVSNVEAGVNADTGYESPLKVDVSSKSSLGITFIPFSGPKNGILFPSAF